LALAWLKRTPWSSGQFRCKDPRSCSLVAVMSLAFHAGRRRERRRTGGFAAVALVGPTAIVRVATTGWPVQMIDRPEMRAVTCRDLPRAVARFAIARALWSGQRARRRIGSSRSELFLDGFGVSLSRTPSGERAAADGGMGPLETRWAAPSRTRGSLSGLLRHRTLHPQVSGSSPEGRARYTEGRARCRETACSEAVSAIASAAARSFADVGFCLLSHRGLP
jgi:hypothetical protein